MTAEKRATEFRQEQIVSMAMALIEQNGLRGLNMAALARQVGIVPSALYRHYKGKREIVGIILDRLKEMMHSNLKTARGDSPDPCARLKLLLDRHFAMLRMSPGIPRLVFSDDLGSRYPSQRVKVLGILVEFMGGVESIVQEGQASGCLRADIQAAAIARLYLGLIQSSSLMWYLSGGRIDPEQGKEEVWRVFEKALKPG